MKDFWKQFMRPTPSKLLSAGFLMLIAIGTLLLSLPISTRTGHSISPINAVFTATSAVCVTGLVVVDTATHWSGFGQAVLLLLIQTGALGIMSVVTLFATITGRQLGLTQRLAIRDSMSEVTLKDVVVTFRIILIATLCIEAVGALLMAPFLIPRYGWGQGIWLSIFHAVSAFCNAGFDLFGTQDRPYASLSGFAGHVPITLITSLLIILGGLGFLVWQELIRIRKFDKYSLHTKVVLVMTGCLLLAGTLLILFTESDFTLAGQSFPHKLLNSFFHSVSTRTAGFNIIAMDELSDAGLLTSLILMFIGAAPGSTAGGIKVTTVFVLIAATISFMRGHSDVKAFHRRIPGSLVIRALTVQMFSLAWVGGIAFLLMSSQSGDLRQSLFEAISAYGTVGLSTGITPMLSDGMKIPLALTMLLGRIGAVTAMMAFINKQDRANVAYRYPEENLTVG